MPRTTTLHPDLLRSLPKVSLHDHLDGGLRPTTIVEIAGEIGHALPADGPEALARWFADSANSGSLVRYLQTFDHTIAVMQTPEHLRRVAREFVEDLAADGVVYGEARWAPEQHTAGGLSEADAVEAVRDGLTEGMLICADQGHRLQVQQLVTSMRQVEPSTRIAELALAYRDQGVAGFDLAGAEDGFPAERFLPAFQLLKQASFPYTIHAGEAAGVESLWGALQVCGANRIGHGVRIVEDITTNADGSVTLGRLAAYVRDQQVPLELCPSSNAQTGAVASLEGHPFALLDGLGFLVTVNSDNKLMSETSLSQEMGVLVEHLGYDLDGLERITLNAAASAFLPHPLREELIDDVILPGFEAARG